MPVTSTSYYQMLHRPFALPTINVLNASPGAAIFGRDMLFDIPFIANWKKIGEHRQRLTDLNTAHENKGRTDYACKVGQKILVRNKGILRKAQSIWQKDPWTIATVHTNGAITIQRGNNQERLNIRRVKPFEEYNELIIKSRIAFF